MARTARAEVEIDHRTAALHRRANRATEIDSAGLRETQPASEPNPETANQWRERVARLVVVKVGEIVERPPLDRAESRDARRVDTGCARIFARIGRVLRLRGHAFPRICARRRCLPRHRDAPPCFSWKASLLAATISHRDRSLARRRAAAQASAASHRPAALDPRRDGRVPRQRKPGRRVDRDALRDLSEALRKND